MKYLRLLKSVLRSIGRTYRVWQMNEVELSGRELHSCVECGMALDTPCIHERNMLASEPGSADHD